MAKHPRIDYLFNNAGVLTETLQFSGHGNELHFEVNTLAPLQLIDGLRPALRSAGGAFIVNTTAGLANRVKALDWDDLINQRSFSNLRPVRQIQAGAQRTHGGARSRAGRGRDHDPGARTPARRKRR